MKSGIEARKLSKKYGFQRVVEDFSMHFDSNHIYGISGRNGSGKSTLIKMLSGFLSPSSGKISYVIDDQVIPRKSVYKHLSLSGPYTDIIQEYTPEEMVNFHQKFKPFKTKLDYKSVEDIMDMKGQRMKPIQYFSSGMKQKINLTLNVLSDTPFLLLDEPTSYLDYHAKTWFKNLLSEYAQHRVIIIASNDSFDLDLCDTVIHI